MSIIDKSTIIYTLITIILAIIYPFFEWRSSLYHYNESKIDQDFNRQLYSVIHGAETDYNKTFGLIQIHTITPKHEQQIGFNLLDAQYSAILSNYIYLINHNTFKHSNDPLISEPLTHSPHNFPFGFHLHYLQLRTENDVNIKWALIENKNADTVYVVLCGTDFLIDILIDISFSPLPLSYTSNDQQQSKSWKSIFTPTKTSDSQDNFLVHGAISGSIQWLQQNITSVLDPILTKNKKLVFCGHSLGAGYATVLAMRMLAKKKSNINTLNIDTKLYTFGAPFVLSILDKDHQAKHRTLRILNKHAFNFVNRFDIIPRMLGPQFEVLYPKFLWNDELLLNQITSFKPIGNYYILHGRDRILYGIQEKDHDLLTAHILKITPKALFSDRNDARTKLVLLIFRFLFGKKYEAYINYLLWISFSAYPLIHDHSMDKYLSMIGDFSSQIAFKNEEHDVMFCLNSALKFVSCEEDKEERYKNDKEWRVTSFGQLQNLRTKECIYMDWKLDELFSWSFKYQLKKTYECSTKITRFKYVNGLKMFKVLSDEHIDDYDDADIDDWMYDDDGECGEENKELMEKDVERRKRDLKGACLGCNVHKMQLNVYQCNESYKDIQTVFYFNPHNIASNEEVDHNEDRLIVPQWSLLNIFDRFF